MIFILVWAALLPAFAVMAINILVYNVSKNCIYGADNVPNKEVILVLGAKVHENGNLSDMFRDRLDTAIILYRADKAGKILVSGDHGQTGYDELNAAKEYLLSRGIPGEDIYLDHAGFDTYDSIYRARDIFMARSLIVVTQEYHLYRALYIAEELDVDAVGARADTRTYAGQEKRELRERLATVKAWLDVKMGARPEYLGDPVPISGPSVASWD